MKILLTIVSLALVIVSILLGIAYQDINELQEENKVLGTETLKTHEVDGEPRVTGIGGIFFFSDDPKATKQWYAENLGVKTNQWGSSFEFRNANRPKEINYLQWSPFKTGSAYFNPSPKPFMINYRVEGLDSLLFKLKKKGVTILDTVQEYEYGKFVHILDLDSNKLELWEPVDSVFTAMGGPTTK